MQCAVHNIYSADERYLLRGVHTHIKKLVEILCILRDSCGKLCIFPRRCCSTQPHSWFTFACSFCHWFCGSGLGCWWASSASHVAHFTYLFVMMHKFNMRWDVCVLFFCALPFVQTQKHTHILLLFFLCRERVVRDSLTRISFGMQRCCVFSWWANNCSDDIHDKNCNDMLPWQSVMVYRIQTYEYLISRKLLR